jgi:hypothetical protein
MCGDMMVGGYVMVDCSDMVIMGGVVMVDCGMVTGCDMVIGGGVVVCCRWCGYE